LPKLSVLKEMEARRLILTVEESLVITKQVVALHLLAEAATLLAHRLGNQWLGFKPDRQILRDRARLKKMAENLRDLEFDL